MLTRAPRGCTCQRRRAACPKAPRSVRTPYAYRPLACRTYRVPYGAPQASSGRSSRSGSPRAPYATQGEPRTNRLGPRTNRAAAHTCGHCHAQAWQQRELMPMYFPMFVHCYIALVARSETETASRIIQVSATPTAEAPSQLPALLPTLATLATLPLPTTTTLLLPPALAVAVADPEALARPAAQGPVRATAHAAAAEPAARPRPRAGLPRCARHHAALLRDIRGTHRLPHQGGPAPYP